MITLRLDKNGGINKGDVQAFEHDNLSEVYIIQLYKNGAIYDLTNKNIELTMVERKRKIGDMVSLPIYNATEGKVKLEVVSDITKQDGIYDFKLTVKDTTGLIETFPNFQVKIKNDITDSITEEIIQDPNFTILTEGLKALADYNIYKTNALKVPEIEKNIVDLTSQLDNIVMFSTDNIINEINKCYNNNLTLKLTKDYTINLNDVNGLPNIDGNNKTLTIIDYNTLPIKNNTTVKNITFVYTKKTNVMFEARLKTNIKLIDVVFDNNDYDTYSNGLLLNFIETNNIDIINVKVNNLETFSKFDGCKKINIKNIKGNNISCLVNTKFVSKNSEEYNELCKKELWSEDINIDNIEILNTIEYHNLANNNGVCIGGYGVRNITISNLNLEYPLYRIFYCSAGENIKLKNITSKGNAGFKFSGWEEKNQNSFITNNISVENVNITHDNNLSSLKSRTDFELYFAKDVFINNVNSYDLSKNPLFILSYKLNNISLNNINFYNGSYDYIIAHERLKVRDGNNSLHSLTDGVDYISLIKDLNIKNINIINSTNKEFIKLIDDHETTSLGYENYNINGLNLNNCSILQTLLTTDKLFKNFYVENLKLNNLPTIKTPYFNFSNLSNENINLSFREIENCTTPVNTLLYEKYLKINKYERLAKMPIKENSIIKCDRLIKYDKNKIIIEFNYNYDKSLSTSGGRLINSLLTVIPTMIKIEIVDSLGTYYNGVIINKTNKILSESEKVKYDAQTSGYYSYTFTESNIFEITDDFIENKNVFVRVEFIY